MAVEDSEIMPVILEIAVGVVLAYGAIQVINGSL
jgi:hypothetical protein